MVYNKVLGGLLMSEEYTCSLCKEEFNKIISDEDAKKQFEEEFPNCKFDPDMPLVCDDCYTKMNAEVPSKNFEECEL